MEILLVLSALNPQMYQGERWCEGVVPCIVARDAGMLAALLKNT